MKRNSSINRLPTFLRSTAMVERCVLSHAEMRRVQGYTFCPWCGHYLQVVVVCEHCGRKFLSEASYKIHSLDFAFYNNNPCPQCSRSTRYLTNRNKFFC